MANAFRHEFNGASASLANKVPEAGSAWLVHPSSSVAPFLSGSGTVRNSTSSTATHYAYSPTLAGGALQYGKFEMKPFSAIANDFKQLAFRIQAADLNDYYRLGYTINSGQWSLARVIDGVATTLTGSVSYTFTYNGVNVIFEVSVQNLADRVRVILRDLTSGTIVQTWEDTDANRITGDGYVGLRGGGVGNGNTTGLHWERLEWGIEGSVITPTKLVWAKQPGNAKLGEFIPGVGATWPRLEAQDDIGNLATTATNAVKILIEDHPSNEAQPVLHGTVVTQLAGGAVNLQDLYLNLPGAGYRLGGYDQQAGSQLTPAISNTFEVTVPSGVRRRRGRMIPQTLTLGDTLLARLRFTLRNADGDPVSGITGKAQLVKNDTGAATASQNDIVAVPAVPGDYYVLLTAADFGALAVKDSVRVVPFGTGVTEVEDGFGVVVGFSWPDAPQILASDGSGRAIVGDHAGTAATTMTNLQTAATGARTAAELVRDRIPQPVADRLSTVARVADLPPAPDNASIASAASAAAAAETAAGLAAAAAADAAGSASDAATSITGMRAVYSDARGAKLDRLDANVTSVSGGTVDLTPINTELAKILEEANQSVEWERVAGTATGYFYPLNAAGARTGKRRQITYASTTSNTILKIGPLVAY